MKATKTIASILLGASLALLQAGCNNSADQGQSAQDSQYPVKTAIADLQPTEGHQTSGLVTFTRVDNGIRVEVRISGFEGGPGERGFHIHENGDCSAPDATSAGGHFNPDDMPHGAPDDSERHAGDFGNLTVDANGNATADFVDTHITFDGPNSIIGRAVIVHAGTDDLTSQPSGDAGPRAACGVIQIVEYVE